MPLEGRCQTWPVRCRIYVKQHSLEKGFYEPGEILSHFKHKLVSRPRKVRTSDSSLSLEGNLWSQRQFFFFIQTLETTWCMDVPNLFAVLIRSMVGNCIVVVVKMFKDVGPLKIKIVIVTLE